MVDDEQRKTKKSAAELMNAKVRVDRAVEQYTQAQRLSGGDQMAAVESLHNAVIGFWWRMREHVRGEDGWTSLGTLEDVTAEAVYTGHHPETGEEVVISGLRELRDWVDKETTVRSESANTPLSSSGGSVQTVSVRLPPEAALTAAEALMWHFNDAGWDAKPEESTHLDEPDGSDLEGLLLARGQTKAASQLPERFKGNSNGSEGGADD
jgi:hypothetical protein